MAFTGSSAWSFRGIFTGYFGGKESVLNDMMLSKFTHQFFSGDVDA